MPNLTPIALTEEEHQRLTSVKHRLEAKSWREMLMKLCDLCDETYEGSNPATPTPQEINLEPIEQRLNGIDKELSNHKHPFPDGLNGEIRRIVKEELSWYDLPKKPTARVMCRAKQREF